MGSFLHLNEIFWKMPGTDHLPSVASVDLADESAGQEDYAQDDRHEQPNEGAGA